MSRPPQMPPSTLQYATPAAYTAPENGMWRRGKTLITSRAATLPPLCIRCGEPEGKSFFRTVYWHPPLLYLMIIFPGLLIYAIVAICVRKKAAYTCSLCPTHAKQRRNALLLVWLGVLLMLASFVFAIAGGNDAFGREYADLTVGIGVIAGIVLLLTTIIYGFTRVPLLKPKKMDEHFVHYSGAGLDFLAPLSELS